MRYQRKRPLLYRITYISTQISANITFSRSEISPINSFFLLIYNGFYFFNILPVYFFVFIPSKMHLFLSEDNVNKNNTHRIKAD